MVRQNEAHWRVPLPPQPCSLCIENATSHSLALPLFHCVFDTTTRVGDSRRSILPLPYGGDGLFIIERMCPEIERSSGCTPRRVLLSNFTLLGMTPPIRWIVMVESALIPCETKSAVFTALANTSTLPDPPVRSFRRNSPVPGAS